jgi:hypothetical protein
MCAKMDKKFSVLVEVQACGSLVTEEQLHAMLITIEYFLMGYGFYRPKYSLKRRLKIRILQYGVARNLNELYDSADTEVILSILVHKVISASLEQGVKEGRLLLHDWLVILISQYNDAYKIVEFGKPGTTGSLDVAFSHCPQLQSFTLACLARLLDSILHGFLHIPFCFRFRAAIFHGFIRFQKSRRRNLCVCLKHLTDCPRGR